MRIKELFDRNKEGLAMAVFVTILSFVVLYVALVLAATF